MAQKTKTLTVAQLLKKKQEEVLETWVTKNIENKDVRVLELMTEKEFRKQTRELLCCPSGFNYQ
ncbi:MAG: RsbRD N-terminal domain-containing protein [Spirochaetota bacterium]|nr:RsbRD N-terminal domain-containing protein [Spirochaetota bacterium]